MSDWLAAFLLGQLFEVPIYCLPLRRRFGPASAVALAFVASLLTHPLVWFVFPALFDAERYWTMAAAAESFAVGAEALYLRLLGVDRPLAWSLAANATSCGVGLAARALFDWP